MSPSRPDAERPVTNEAFALANRAFNQFTLAEREQALAMFANLRYPSIADRFIDAVHSVIVRIEQERKLSDA